MLSKHNFVHECLPLAADRKDIRTGSSVSQMAYAIFCWSQNVQSKILSSTCVAPSLCIPHPADANANVCFLKTKNLC